MEKNVIQINGGITINVDLSVKNVIYVKMIIFEAFYMQLQNEKYLASIMDDSTIGCDEVIESNNKETKTISTKFNENKAICEVQNIYFYTCIFINYYSIIDSYQYLPLFDKRSSDSKNISYHFASQITNQLFIY